MYNFIYNFQIEYFEMTMHLKSSSKVKRERKTKIKKEGKLEVNISVVLLFLLFLFETNKYFQSFYSISVSDQFCLTLLRRAL